MKKWSLFAVLLAALSFTQLFTSCETESTEPTPEIPEVDFLLLSGGNKIDRYAAQNLMAPVRSITVSGLGMGEQLLAIDFRPATGQLYGVSSGSRLYAINQNTGVATALGTAPFSPAIDGNVVGFDFNPTVDRIRLVTANGQNLRLHPELGTVVATDGAVNGVMNARISGAAYTENFAGTTTTALYNIDPQTDQLYKQDPPNDGTQVVVGSLGVDLTGDGGFDISPENIALAFYGNTLYQIDFMTGKATALGVINGVAGVTGLAIPTNPVAYAVTATNDLLIFNPENPAPITKPITGLPTGQSLVGIDFRPATGQLFGIGKNSSLYTINTANGAATAVGSNPLGALLTGEFFGFDFNPTVDRIRVVSDSRINLRLNPTNGTLAALDGGLNPGTPMISGAAYTNNFPGATTTVLYDIDAIAGKLFKQDPPNNGGLVEVGNLGVTATSNNGFDIGGTSDKAWALLKVNNATRLYQINLMTGAATQANAYTFMPDIQGFAVGLGF